jgi:toxin ParE1/3/4
MKLFKVSLKANQDLLDVGAYTQERWGVIQRDKYLDELNNAFESLASNPELGPKYESIRPFYRGYFIGKHIIFYIVYKYGVRIVRVLQQNMLYTKHL